ncbi:hypothetical protein BDZ88DRAFT_426055 [Geranomyces variabilis]|nr:hypothetical protein BDZ88DRAFT_426055 [Geranomyces variabilis]
MDVSQCAANPDVQKLVLNSTSPVVQQLIYQSAVTQGVIAQYEAGIATLTEACEANVEWALEIAVQYGGSSIFIGIAWSFCALGTAVSVWRAYTKSSLRANLLALVMAVTIADCANITWARSSDPRVVYGDHIWTYASMLTVFPFFRNSVLLIASALRYQVVLTNAKHRRMLVAASVFIGVASTAVQYALAFTSFAKNGATSASTAFWITTIIQPIAYSVFGLATFTMAVSFCCVLAAGEENSCKLTICLFSFQQLRKNRKGITATSASGLKMRNLEFVNNVLGFTIFGSCIIVIAMAFGENQQTGYYTSPVMVAGCAIWAAGENLFEIIAQLKTTTEAASISSHGRKEASASMKQSAMKLAQTSAQGFQASAQGLP